jgi:signal peptidase II
VIAVVASGLIVFMLKRQSAHTLVSFGLALILGGALGNLWDRLLTGAVVDFIQWHWHDAYWPAFNVADSAITCGAVILVIQSLRGRSSSS